MNSVEFTLLRREARIREWMLATVSNGGIERLDDLHVDNIDEDWAQPTNWVDAGFTAYRLAMAVKDKLGLDVTVALGFSLVDDVPVQRRGRSTFIEYRPNRSAPKIADFQAARGQQVLPSAMDFRGWASSTVSFRRNPTQ
jgi:hypothetical protein